MLIRGFLSFVTLDRLPCSERRRAVFAGGLMSQEVQSRSRDFRVKAPLPSTVLQARATAKNKVTLDASAAAWTLAAVKIRDGRSLPQLEAELPALHVGTGFL